MEEKRLRYPLSIQSFAKLRREGFVYVDKTEYVYRMTHADSSYIFLSRPRRFGKSLLTSTLHCYFEGRKELFEGLAIERLEKDWKQYPVLHFDFSKCNQTNLKTLHESIDEQLSSYEAVYGRKSETCSPGLRFGNLIESVSDSTGKEVVILIDEYDAPLLDVANREKELKAFRETMRDFYSPLKAYGDNIRFVFLTGITKFSQLTIFSELNNITDISMNENYAGICGISEKEIDAFLTQGIERLAQKRNKSEDIVLSELKNMYDGYHFTWPSEDIYNPYSLLNALSLEKISNYWFTTGTPGFLVELLRRYDCLPQNLDNLVVEESSFNTSVEEATSAIPILYQGGYLTIKNYDDDVELYHLRIPNKEVRISLMKSLLPEYVGKQKDNGMTMVAMLSRDIKENNIETALKRIQAFLKTIPYTSNASSEGHYQQLLYVIFTLLGHYVDIEVHTPCGRVDMVIRTDTRLYLIELKLDKSAGAAMQQINLKDYASAFALSGLPVTKVGVNFDSSKRTISDWEIEE